jgi:hypothetical protein
MTKLAKIYLALIAICFLTPLCLAQDTIPPPPPGTSAKDAEKWNKKQQKVLEKSQERILKEEAKHPKATSQSNNNSNVGQESDFVITNAAGEKIHQKSDFVTGITPEKVALFFDDYVGKTIKFSVWLGKIELSQDNTGKVYGITVQTEDKQYFFGKVLPKRVQAINFVLSEAIARKTMEAQEELSNTVDGRASTDLRGANIYTEIKQFGDYNVATVLCIEFIGIQSQQNGRLMQGVIKSIGCQ